MMEVLYPPNVGENDYGSVQTYLMSNPTVTGAVIEIDWSDFDLGDASTGMHTSYDFTITDALIQPWVAAGKKVSFAIQNSPYGGGGTKCPATGHGSHGNVASNCAIPGWMWNALGTSNITTCGTTQVPNFRASTFVSSYQAALKALVANYATNPSVAYIRTGLGIGGEINLPQGWDKSGSACYTAYTTTWGYTVGADATFTWNAYLKNMIEFEGSLASPIQLMTSITPVVATGVTGDTVPDFIAPIAVMNHVGFGNQGLQASDVNNCAGAGGDWCKLFATYTGQVPLELQTFGQSCPDSTNCPGGNATEQMLSKSTGPLPPLLPWAVKNHATILELYYEDWLVAFDPTYNAMYSAAYTSAIQAAAQGM